ncbi:MAG: uracil phosphoribosyltransferase [Patescibacteria group bacterium]|nr:uracil phosphoribosyltransferase [Patescibacteria group bacterium]MDE2590889.1 uracil phosphoribosyltransferase [Patescibacteria group bacterium]
MQHVSVIETPVVKDALTYLRNCKTDTKTFRFYAETISYELLSAALRIGDMRQMSITTPLAQMQGKVLDTHFVFITIFRAGLAMLPAALRVFPGSGIGFVGLKRDELTAIANEYYVHLPNITSQTTVLLADPMLATGGSMLSAIEKISKYQPKEIRIVSVICAPEGIKAVHKKFPDVKIFTAAVDNYLNDKKYIVPGLGDFGDRYFATT